MKFKKITNILGIIAICIFLSFFLIPEPDINNFPIIEILGSFLFASLVLITITGIIFTIVKRKDLSLFEKIFPLLGAIFFLGTMLLDIYGPPVVDVEVTYLGQKPDIKIDVSFGSGSSGFGLKKNETRDWSEDRPTEYLIVSWGDSYANKEKKKEFDVSNEIPKYGSDRSLKISIFDEDVKYEVIKK
jgi:hypothetical protein